jgi:hypothetical protein
LKLPFVSTPLSFDFWRILERQPLNLKKRPPSKDIWQMRGRVKILNDLGAKGETTNFGCQVTWFNFSTSSNFGPEPTSKIYSRCWGAARHCSHLCLLQHFAEPIGGQRTIL